MADADGMLLDLYKNEENLWDSAHPDYFNREKKRKSLSFIAQMLGNGCTEEAVKKKIAIFRTLYARHLAKQLRIQKDGSTTHTPKWKWFAFMDTFLRTHVSFKKPHLGHQDTNRGTRRPDIMQMTLDVNGQDNQLHEDVLRRPQSPSSVSVSPSESGCDSDTERHDRNYAPSRKRKDPLDAIAETMQHWIHERKKAREAKKAKPAEGTNDSFGRFIANELNELPDVKQRAAKLKIHQIIYELKEEDN